MKFVLLGLASLLTSLGQAAEPSQVPSLVCSAEGRLRDQVPPFIALYGKQPTRRERHPPLVFSDGETLKIWSVITSTSREVVRAEDELLILDRDRRSVTIELVSHPLRLTLPIPPRRFQGIYSVMGSYPTPRGDAVYRCYQTDLGMGGGGMSGGI